MSLLSIRNITARLIAVIMAAIVGFGSVRAMDASRHAPNSKLAQGKWVKISVANSGVHFLSKQSLASMGFSTPLSVRIYGYGAQMLPDILSPETYIDDLPPVQTLVTDQGIFFYANGPEWRVTDNGSNYYLKNNPFTNYGFYFLTADDGSEAPAIPTSGYPEVIDGVPATQFIDVIHHENDVLSPGETGHILVGEDLRYTPSRSFTFTLTDPADGTASLGASLFINLINASSWDLEAQGYGSKKIAAPSSTSASNIHGTITTSWLNFETTASPTVTAKITLGSNSTNTRLANVDWITLNYPRQLKMPASGAMLAFTTSAKAVKIANATAGTVVWDVTDPKAITIIDHSAPGADGSITFSSNVSGQRNYVAFNTTDGSKLSAPAFVENVSNQNIHALNNVDMVIFSPQQWISAARTLADYRSTRDGITVEVVNVEQVYNEFSSGSPDVNAFRKLLKMLYDRGQAGGTAPRYALLMGRSSFDNRGLTASSTNLSYKPLPQWQTWIGDNDNTSYPTDDILGFLDDGSGASMNTDVLRVAVGRLPATSLTQANLLVDKIMEYETSSPFGSWRQRGVFIADDDDSGVHMSQTETMISRIQDSPGGRKMTVEKIYLDAYEYTNGVATGAREEFYRDLDEGVLWLNYVGHASSTALSGEGILNYSDLGSIYLRKLPFIYAATCDFMRWDASTVSGAEHLALTKGGGVIGAMSATRPVYISNNALITEAMGCYLMTEDNNGRQLTIGEVAQRAKNSLVNDANKLRYVLLADPSMRLLAPTHDIVIETVDGKEFPYTDADAVLQARQDVVLGGSVRDGATGSVLTDFNGTLSSTLYDADESVTTLGHGTSPVLFTFDKHGSRLFAGSDTIVGGRFELNMAMPSEVADNYRPASLALFAVDNNETRTAATVERGLYVYGTDEDAAPDTIPPTIDVIYLNHPSFVNGGVVNASPMLIAEISDNHAINMSLAGIGHWMSLSLDEGAITYNDISNYYQPESVQKGKLYYQLSDLEDGAHTITLRVWDAAGNSASATVEFFVDNTTAMQVFEIYSDKNPATDTANFYLVHDRPDGDLKVEMMVYDMLGRIVWTNTSTGRADRYRSFPVTWNLCDNAGRRVSRGIYLYRAVVSDLKGSYGSASSTVTPTKKLAVTSR